MRWHVLETASTSTCSGQTPSAGPTRAARYGLGDELAIGVACALRPRKQLEHLFRAAARLDDPIRVVVAGGPVPGDEAYAEQLLAEGRALLGDRLLVLGHLDEFAGFYNALDLFVNTSQEEACSISVIESLACGCPVVGYASRSVDEQILPGGGEIVPQDDDQALTDALAAVAVGPGSAARRSRWARAEQATTLFDIRALADDLFAQYTEVLAERGAPALAR